MKYKHLIILIFISLFSSFYYLYDNDKSNIENINININKDALETYSLTDTKNKNEAFINEKEKIKTKNSENNISTTPENKIKIITLPDPFKDIDLKKLGASETIKKIKSNGKLSSDDIYTIAMILHRCLNAPKNLEELKRKTNELYQSSYASFELEESLKSDYKICVGIEGDYAKKYTELLEEGAENNHLLSMIAYSSIGIVNKGKNQEEDDYLMNKYQANRKRYVNKSIELGSVFTLIDEGLRLSDNDKVKSFAYLKLANHYQPSPLVNKANELYNSFYEYEKFEAEQLYQEMLSTFGEKEGVKLFKRN